MSSSFRTGRRVTGHEDEAVTRPSVAPSTEQAEPVDAERDDHSGEPSLRPPTTLNRPTKAEQIGELRRLLDESAAVEAMLLDTVAGRKPPTTAVPGNVGSAATAQPKTRRRARFVGAVLVVVLVVVNAVALTRLNHDSKPTAEIGAAPRTPTVIAAALSWVGRELSRNAKFVADPAVRARLVADRFTHVQTPAGSSGAAFGFDYVISTAALRLTAAAAVPVRRALETSLPIAVFGSGADQVVVRQVLSVSKKDIAERRSADQQIRRTAEQQLLVNPAIRASGAARAALQTGQLDLRAATVLALIANSSHLVIISVNVDKAEQAAGLPARSVDIQTDAPDNVQAMLANLPPSYQPSKNTRLPNGTHRMAWSIDPEPPPALN